MARSPFGSARGSSLLDLAVAALAGGSVAFAVFAMPDPLFAQIVVASRLPDFLPAAQPPLGDTARWAAVAAAGIAAFALVWALLRALDRVPARRRPPAETGFAEPPAEVPRVRRADAHPDAPTRRPLRAGRELGEPIEGPPAEEDSLELVDLAPEEKFADLVPQPLPGFLVPQQPEPAAEAAEPAAPAEPALPGVPAEPARNGESLSALTAQFPEAPAERRAMSIGDLMHRLESGLSRRRQPVAEEAAARPATAEAASPPVTEEAAPPPVTEEAAPPPVTAEAAPPSVAEEAPPQPAVEAPRAPVPAAPSRTPLDLSSPAPPPAEAMPPAEDRVGHRLRSAINDLHKLSGHG